jgi:hypothetical protein
MSDKTKAEFLQWLLKPRHKGYPFVTYRGGAMKADLNLCIPFEDIEEFFGVTEITINGEVWRKKGTSECQTSRKAG